MIETIRTFTALSEEFVELFMKHHPVAATSVGIHDYDHLLPDDSPAGFEARAAWLRDLEQRLAASVPFDELPLEARVDCALLRSRISVLRADLEEISIARRTPSVFLSRVFAGVQSVLSRPYAPLDERKEAAVARLMAIPDYLDGVRAHFDVVPPELLEAGIEMAARGPSFVDDVVRRLLRQFPGEAERLEHAGSRARTGFLRLHDHLDREARARAGGTFAISERWMNYRLEREHVLAYTCSDIETLARDAVERARTQLEEEAGRLDRRRTWRELVDDARTRHPEASWLREAYLTEIERARQFMVDRRLVPLPEGERIDIAETAVFYRASLPVASYQGPAPFDADTAGQFLLTPVDLRRDKQEQARQLEGHCSATIPVTALRETYPGHHVRHLFGARASTRLRRMTRNTVMAEGWALYAEEMMSEAGFFTTDPATRLFQLLSVLRSACLARVDIGLHSGRMSIDEGVTLLVEEARLDPEHARVEVRSCCVSPTRGLAALVGKVAILDLRDEARRRLGERFDAGAFHGGLLAGGTLPPALVREELWERLGLSK